MAGTLFLGTVIDGRYRVDQEIGSGGFATVHAGFDSSLGVPIVVKFLRLSAETPAAIRAELLAGFLEEGRLVTHLRHDHIVRTLGQGVYDGTPYVVLEWCGDESLAHMLRGRNGVGLPLDVAYRLIEATTSAVAHAHALGVVHRDLEPGNVLLARSREGEWLPRVTDFGIAKLFEQEHPAGDSVSATRFPAKYTPAYAAPEQVLGLRTGPWTDVHGIGLLFVELTTGRAPYSAPGLGPIGPRRPSPRDFGVDVGAFEPVIARALAFDPRHRYQNAGELLVALRTAPSASRSGVSSLVGWALGLVFFLVVATGAVIGVRYALASKSAARVASSSVAAVPASAAPPSARLAGRGVLLSAMSLADLEKRARAAGVEVTGVGEVVGNVYVHFLDQGNTGIAYVTLAPMHPDLPAETRELGALAAIKSWIDLDRAHGLELVYGVQGDYVLSVAGADQASSHALFDKLARGIELRIRGSSFGRPDPATNADDARLHWRAKSLSDLSLAELLSRIVTSDASIGEVKIEPDHWTVALGRGVHKGRVDVFFSETPDATQREARVPFVEARSGNIRVVAEGPGGIGQKVFLDRVLRDLESD